jgi:act minimal PKS acyl carrier protein
MRALNVADLRDMLEEVAGGEDGAWDDAGPDTPFDELGYDSLALVGLLAKVRRDTGVVIPDEELVGMGTPGAALLVLNTYLAGRSGAVATI